MLFAHCDNSDSYKTGKFFEGEFFMMRLPCTHKRRLASHEGKVFPLKGLCTSEATLVIKIAFTIFISEFALKI